MLRSGIRRRALLGSLVGLTALSGCQFGQSSEETGTPAQTPGPTSARELSVRIRMWGGESGRPAGGRGGGGVRSGGGRLDCRDTAADAAMGPRRLTCHRVNCHRPPPPCQPPCEPPEGERDRDDRRHRPAPSTIGTEDDGNRGSCRHSRGSRVRSIRRPRPVFCRYPCRCSSRGRRRRTRPW